MKFLANENFSGKSVQYLKEKKIDISWITDLSPSISDKEVMDLASHENRIILTHDSDYGELIFKYKYKPPSVIYFRISQFSAEEPAQILFGLIESNHSFQDRLTVIDSDSIKERKY